MCMNTWVIYKADTDRPCYLLIEISAVLDLINSIIVIAYSYESKSNLRKKKKKDLAHVDYKKVMTANFDDFYEAHIEALKNKTYN